MGTQAGVPGKLPRPFGAGQAPLRVSGSQPDGGQPEPSAELPAAMVANRSNQPAYSDPSRSHASRRRWTVAGAVTL